MKKRILGIIAIIAAIAFVGFACGGGGGGGTTYNIGDTGPGGGIVFYYNATGFTVYQDKDDTVGITCNYLEVAPEDLGPVTWASFASSVTGLAEDTIGSGKANTDIIITAYPKPVDNASNNAAWACVDYRGPENKDDWFFPNLGELEQVYLNLVKDKTGHGFLSGYWASYCDADPEDAKGLFFNTGFTFGGGKDYSYTVRPIRAF